MTEEETWSRACGAVKAYYSQASVVPDSIRATGKAKNFLDGVLVFVNYQSGRDRGEKLVYVYLKENDALVLRSVEELSQIMNVYRPERSLYQILSSSIFIVPPVIALFITCTFCFLVLKGQREFPEVMSNALTLIIGFYFGSLVTKRAP